MTENFNFDVLLAEAEARLDEEAVPEHFGTEITLAEGEHWTGTRGGDIDERFDPPRAVVLLTELDGELRFLRVRTMLERGIAKAATAAGDLLAIVRGADVETATGRQMQTWGVSSRPRGGDADAVPAAAPLATTDIPF